MGDDPGNSDDYENLQGLISSLGGSSADVEKKATLDKQRALAQQLGQGPNIGKGTYIPGSHGGVYVGQGIFPSLVAGAQWGKGINDQENALAQEQGMNSTEAQNRTRLMSELVRQGIQPPMQDVTSDLQNMQPNVNIQGGQPSGGTGGNASPAPVTPQAPPQQPMPHYGQFQDPNANYDKFGLLDYSRLYDPRYDPKKDAGYYPVNPEVTMGP